MLPVGEIQRILKSYELDASISLAEKISAYVELILAWNRRISLTSIKDPKEIVQYHFVESFLGANIAGPLEGRLADVGTGAGFPGLALKLYVPSVVVTLIEPNAKKCAFLGEVVRKLDLQGVEICRSRFEDFAVEAKFDAISSRALGNLAEFLSWGAKATKSGGKALLWLGAEGVEEAQVAGTEWQWREPYAIPETRRRFILIGTRIPEV